jgi:hypothetical protein
MASKPISADFSSDVTRPDHERFPELFRQGPMADRHKATRVVPMKVLVFGLMRTGTSCMMSTAATLASRFSHVL